MHPRARSAFGHKTPLNNWKEATSFHCRLRCVPTHTLDSLFIFFGTNKSKTANNRTWTHTKACFALRARCIACKCACRVCLGCTSFNCTRPDSFAFPCSLWYTHSRAFAFKAHRNAFVNYQLVYERAPFLVYNYAKRFEQSTRAQKCQPFHQLKPIYAWENITIERENF